VTAASASYSPPTAEALTLARERLAELDPSLAPLHAVTPAFEWRLRPGGLAGLAKMIVEQQVSVAAAASIWGRLQAGLGEVTAEALLARRAEDLLPFGLSRPKARYVRGLAEAWGEGRIDFAALRSMDDESAVAALTALKGVGRWTAETYLMFCEGRLDVFPGGDVALQEAIRWADRAGQRPSEKAAYLRAEGWRPYRGVAAHLLWRCYGAVKRGEIAPIYAISESSA
jgi:DNA-3-methyladenine glycosylase II